MTDFKFSDTISCLKISPNGKYAAGTTWDCHVLLIGCYSKNKRLLFGKSILGIYLLSRRWMLLCCHVAGILFGVCVMVMSRLNYGCFLVGVIKYCTSGYFRMMQLLKLEM